MVFNFGKTARFVNVYDIGLSPLQYISKTFTSKVTLAKVRKGLVTVAFHQVYNTLMALFSKKVY